MYVAAAPTVVAMVLEPDCDAGVTQSCCELLRCFVAKGREALLEWAGAPPAATLQMLCDVLARVLRPDGDDMAAMFVGGLMLAVRLSAEVAVRSDLASAHHPPSTLCPCDP